jgi:predicted adenylyl cyclase CyaB
VARNIEIKARIEDIEALAVRTRAIADQGPVEIFQDDTFFRCEAGRLKLRTFSENLGELIFYKRPDQAGPKESFYLISRTAEPKTLLAALTQAYGIVGRVRKRRTLYMVGRTRVHLDRVEGLGDFMELEVVLQDGEPASVGVEEAHRLMERLGVDGGQLVEGAYVDLMAVQAAD